MVPHVAARKTHQRLQKFLLLTPKRLLQQYRPRTDIDCWDRCGDKRALDYPALRNGLGGSKNGAGDSDLTIFLPKLHVVDQLLRAFLALQSTAARYFVRECPAIRLPFRSKTRFRCPCLARAFGDRSVRWRNRCGFATRAGVGMF